MLRERLQPLLVALCCGALALPFAGCGDDDPATTSSTVATTATEAELTPVRRDLEAQLRKLIEAGDAKVDPECVIDELRTSLSNAVVEAATDAADRGEEIPTEAVDAAYAAGQACARP